MLTPALKQFLDQPTIAAMTAIEARDAAIAYTEGSIYRINDEERKIQVLTRLIVENTLARLDAAMAESFGATDPQMITYGEIARQLRAALDPELLMNELYFINLGNPEVAQGYAAAVNLGLLTPTELAAFEQAATHTSAPFATTTLKDVLIHRGQMSYKEVNINTNAVEERDWLLVQFTPSLNPDFEPYTPQIYRMIHGDYKVLNSFEKPVETDGGYKVFINKNRGTFYVDDQYQVVV